MHTCHVMYTHTVPYKKGMWSPCFPTTIYTQRVLTLTVTTPPPPPPPPPPRSFFHISIVQLQQHHLSMPRHQCGIIQKRSNCSNVSPRHHNYAVSTHLQTNQVSHGGQLLHPFQIQDVQIFQLKKSVSHGANTYVERHLILRYHISNIFVRHWLDGSKSNIFFFVSVMSTFVVILRRAAATTHLRRCLWLMEVGTSMCCQCVQQLNLD